MAERKTTGKSNTTRKNSGKSPAAKSGRASSVSRGSNSRSGSTTRSSSSRSSASSRGSARSNGGYGRTASYAARQRQQEQQSDMERDIILVLLFAGMVFLFLSNFGLFGMVGAFFQRIMMGVFGWGAYFLPILTFALVLYGMMNRGGEGVAARISCILVLYLVLTIVCDLASGEVAAKQPLDIAAIWERCVVYHNGGGVLGGLFAWIFMHTVGTAGTVLVLVVVTVICAVYVTRQPLLQLLSESAVDTRDRVRYRREAEAEYRSNHPEEYDDAGFLPDDEDDELTESDIAAYRQRQAERNRAERQERLREQAYRDVERRHDARHNAEQTFRGIIGDTNLSNDPYLTRTAAEPAKQDLPAEDLPMEESAAENTGFLPSNEDVVKAGMAAAGAATATAAEITASAAASETKEAAIAATAAATAVTVASTATAAREETISAAAQLLRNQQPGTDGIQLAIKTPSDVDSYESTPEDVHDAVRTAIPIYRESNNLHEINALEFQNSYAALARDTMQAQESDEDLTTRIIREGMADLDESRDPAMDTPGTGAQSAAADAFARSTSFTEIQDAYRQDEHMTKESNDHSAESENDMDDPAETAQAFEEIPAAVSPVQKAQDPENMTDAQEDVDDEPPVVMTTDDEEELVPQMHEITTPVGSGSPLAAAHASQAQIHSAASVEPQTSTPATAAPQPAARAAKPVKKARKYAYPPLNLLSAGNPSKDSGSDEELRHTAEVLETTLHTFGVNCKITDISQGPAVTRYELLPEQGVKVSKVVGLSDDIKLALAAMDIRIEAPIPGKSAIGIEVPNKVTSMVALRDILSNPNFRDHKSTLAIGIGKDISGQIVVSDLAKMPHVLIAGATGSGKSVCINTIIMSILYHASPEEVKLLMIDPKVVELSVYNGIPHLLYPVVTNPQQAATLLNWAVAEMESRYRRFADAGVRDMKGYNQMVQHELDHGNTTDKEGNPLHVMPRIVVIVDELADLMMVAKNDVETAICRLAQLARAAGIHLIIATQRPSVDVITGLIKANMPSRIAFAVSSGVDSRTILDMNGAEKLLGKGDMLFFPQGLPKPARIQGAFVSDDEVLDVVSFIKEHNAVDAEEENAIRQQMENLGTASAGNGGGSGGAGAQDAGNGMDELFRRAGKFIIDKNNASIGLLQRGFRIGFNRAARLMDQLCEAGVVAESEGTKSRRILMTEAEFEAYCNDNDIS